MRTCFGMLQTTKKEDDTTNKKVYKNTALLIAAAMNSVDALKELIKAGANIEAENQFGSPLLVATANNHVNAMKELISAGANIERGDLIFGRTPLFIAAANNSVDALKELIKAGANIESVDMFGRTPLARAAERNCLDALKQLISAGANIETVDQLHTPLDDESSQVMRQYLIDTHQVIPCDKFGRTPLLIAAANNSVDALKELIKAGANIESVDKDGKTALDIARAHRHKMIITLLMEQTSTAIQTNP